VVPLLSPSDDAKATSDQQQLFNLNLEKTKLTNRLQQALAEETALREELIRLRADVTVADKTDQVPASTLSLILDHHP
jgi:hypothetical protein